MKVSKIDSKPPLEKFSFRENGRNYWWASWYANILGYKSLATLKPSIDKAKKACLQLGISYEENFLKEKTDHGIDYKLTKFACFLISLHADSKKPIVKKARTYFLNELEEVNILMNNQDYLNRMLGKEEIKNLNKTLASIGRSAKVKDFRYFINEGYMGLYNQTSADLKRSRGIPVNANINDYIGMTELSANIFRLTLTAERLKRLSSPTERKAAEEHWKIAYKIRSLIKENMGLFPEELPLKRNLKLLQKKLKVAQKQLNSDVAYIE